MLSSHLLLVFLSGTFPSGLPSKILYAFISHAFYMTHPHHALNKVGEAYKLLKYIITRYVVCSEY